MYTCADNIALGSTSAYTRMAIKAGRGGGGEGRETLHPECSSQIDPRCRAVNKRGHLKRETWLSGQEIV